MCSSGSFEVVQAVALACGQDCSGIRAFVSRRPAQRHLAHSEEPEGGEPGRVESEARRTGPWGIGNRKVGPRSVPGEPVVGSGAGRRGQDGGGRDRAEQTIAQVEACRQMTGILREFIRVPTQG